MNFLQNFKHLKALLLFIGVTWLFAFFPLSRTQLNVVTTTYSFGAAQMAMGNNPYLEKAPQADQFKYSPLFASLYAPLLLFSPQVHVLFWALLNVGVFWWGFFVWGLLEPKAIKVLWPALLVASMEMNGAVLYQQVNALLTGMVLLALYGMSQTKAWGTGLLALASNFKVVPVVFMFGFLKPRLLKVPLHFFLWSLIFLLLPAVLLGGKALYGLTLSWFGLLLGDSSLPGILDIATVLGAYELSLWGQGVKYTVLATSLLSLVCLPTLGQTQGWGLWISVGLLMILLFSPRTESPTFVLAAPAMVFCFQTLSFSPSKKFKFLTYGLWGMAVILITVSHNDIWPKKIWDLNASNNYSKTWGTLLLWMLVMGLRHWPQGGGRKKSSEGTVFLKQ